MANTAAVQTAPQTNAEYEAEFELLMQEASRLNELMGQERTEIEWLKAETKVLAEETWRLRDETRAVLASIGARL